MAMASKRVFVPDDPDIIGYGSLGWDYTAVAPREGMTPMSGPLERIRDSRTGLTRRGLLPTGGLACLLGTRVGVGKASTAPGLYKSIGVKPVINCR